jgi:hypothetical protein
VHGKANPSYKALLQTFFRTLKQSLRMVASKTKGHPSKALQAITQSRLKACFAQLTKSTQLLQAT